jgi:hypothetical protein
MAWRGLPVALVIATAFADAAGAHRLAFYALVAAVPATAVAGLSCLGEIVDSRLDGSRTPVGGAQGILWALALTLILVGAAARGPFVSQGVLPHVALSALVAALLTLGLQTGLAVLVEARRLPERRPIPAVEAVLKAE